ncbi:DELLA protein GAI-like [Solanum dulcamara]|uniref:DELLA protein GAI-like n=1 Tax=Solanum dulcamara TaxID=45834 RepID=UPI0024861957|nr:DELLA protein GAI-like [Solanum dulcamara]
MSSGEMSMDTVMEDEDSFVSNTNAVIYAASDISGWTHSLISDNNITNSSSSTSVDDRHHHQQISTAAGGDGDSMNVSSSASSSWFKNNKEIDDQRQIRIFNVDFRALSNRSYFRSPLLADTGRTVNEESRVRLVNTLMACAKAIQENNLSLADVLISELRRFTVSQIGGAMKKEATYFAEAFYQKIYRTNPQDFVESSYSKEKLLHISFYGSCPLLKFAHFTANLSILEAFADSKRIHVIDFSLNQGLQWSALLQALTLRPGGPPAFRLTGIGGHSQPDDSSDALEEVGFKLAQFAESIGVEFEFQGFMAHTLADLEAPMLNIRPSNVEAVAVNSVFKLHRLFSIPGSIEKVLDLIKQIEPKIVTIAEREVNHNESVFMNRINEAWHHYATIFDILENSDLINPNTLDLEMAEQSLGREIYNLVACEGTKRVVRHETLGQWRVRFNSARFNLVPLSSNTYRQADMLLALFINGKIYRVEEKDGYLMLSWHSRPLITISAWRGYVA